MKDSTQATLAILFFIITITILITNEVVRNNSPKIAIHKIATYSIEYKHSGLFIEYTKRVDVPKSVFDKINDGDTIITF